MNSGLKEKRVFITGGDRGLGRAICENFAAEGAKIAVGYHTNGEAAGKDLPKVKGCLWGKGSPGTGECGR